MKAFIFRVFVVVVFLIGLGGVAEKISLFFQPQEREFIKLAEFRSPDLKVVRLNGPQKIVVRRFQIDNPDHCQVKIGATKPGQFEQNLEVVREEEIPQ